ncbi:MAG: tRNA (guanine(10)-N(2))-dimethyltransferase [Candidatus Thorarchaeota archaeon]|nr:MAG: tRNA (guanine(10)-N(2))-dimethyltransferase [Candidatus Thorarchaeota archaeon]
MIIEKEYAEGRTKFLSADLEHYAGNRRQLKTDLPVFYNPRMRINRDLSVLFLSAYKKNSPLERICEPLAGCGVRTLRYLNECPGEFHAVISDVNPHAVEMIEKNVGRLGFQERVTVKKGDAKILLLTESRDKRFDFADIDPFGSPAPYLTAAIQSLAPRQALLGVTATDMPVLCGAQPKIAQRKYGGLSIRTPFSHELAIRLLIGRVFDIAAMNDLGITPLASLSTDHYVRIWLKTKTSCIDSNAETKKIGYVLYCRDCMATQFLPLGLLPSKEGFEHERADCGGRLYFAGPLWIGELYDLQTLETAQHILWQDPGLYDPRVPKLLDTMKEESSLTDYIYTDLHALCDLHGLQSRSIEQVMSSLKEAGYEVCRTHFRPTAIRTTAPIRELVDIIRQH